MKTGELKVTFDGMKKFLKGLEVLRSSEVLVGIPQSETERNDEGDEVMNNATIGYINENGSDIANIPPRPHLIPGIKAVQPEIVEEFKKAGKAALTSEFNAVLRHFNRAGIIASQSVKKIINEQTNFEPISPATLKARNEIGFKGTKALIVTAQYRNAITYVVGDKTKGK